jgi:hypothetical protein
MKSVYNKTKVKSWIKKAYKHHLLVYGHGYITDGYVLLVDEPHMHPTILDVFGTLTPECKYSADRFQKSINLPDKPIEVIDSHLELVLDPKCRLRIFYDPKTGKELTIDCVYFELFDNPEFYGFYVNDRMTQLWITYNNEVVGVVALYRLKDQLSHVTFKPGQEG